MKAPIRILVTDDHELVLEGLTRLLDDQADMEVIARATEGETALRLAQTARPDVALLDVSLPGRDGITIAQDLARLCPEVRTIAVTRHSDKAFVTRMLNAGASGYILKQSSSSELVRAVRAVAGGRQYIDTAIQIPQPAVPRLEPVALRGEALTAHEEQVLRLVALSWSNLQIAGRLTLDLTDVAALRRSAMQKAGLTTRIEVITYARSRRWLD